MVWTGYKRSVRAILFFAAAAAVALGLAPARAGAAWRAFAPTSPWNVPAAQKGGISPLNPFASQFTSYSSSLEISGVAPDNKWGKPIFFAKPGDPEYGWTDQNGWAKGDIRYQGEPIPMPDGAHEATGSDGHLTIVTADRRYEYDMWRADVSRRTAQTIVRFDLAGGGVPLDRSDNTSARGSGTPVIPTTVRADEALTGIDHALGLTVPGVAGDYLFPATHSDGKLGSNEVKYGMLFILRPDFPVAAGTSLGERNIIAALKTYGAYVVDQGASMGIDADSTHADIWSQAGMLGDSSMPIQAGDWRLVNVGSASAAGPPPAPRAGRRVVLRAARRSVRVGGRIGLRGQVRGGFSARARVRVMVHSGSRWVRMRKTALDGGGTFSTKVAPRNVRLGHGRRVLRILAVVNGVGRSNVVRVRVRR
jgi:hypothetical protein